MSKNTRTLLIAAAFLVAAYLAYRWYAGKKAADAGSSITPGIGSNLNSVAPDLIGGAAASGTYAGPAASIPVSITLNETSPPEQAGNVPMEGVNAVTPSALDSQTAAAGTWPGSPDTASELPDEENGAGAGEQGMTVPAMTTAQMTPPATARQPARPAPPKPAPRRPPAKRKHRTGGR
ncbi:MAG: hypothetical protein ACRD1G_14735 [Acidimicrobiales bacterium]